MTADPAAGWVDAHQHVWDRRRHPQAWIDPATMAALDRDFSLADLRPHALGAGVSATVLVQTVHDPAETDHLLERAAASDLVGAVVGWADLTAPDLPDRIARWRSGPGGALLAGFRHLVQDEPDPDWLDRPAVRRGLRVLAAHDLGFDLLVRPPQLPAAVRVVRDLPEVRFVLDHLAKPPLAAAGAGTAGDCRAGDGAEWAAWAAGLRALAGAENVSAKVSGLVTEADPRRCAPGDLRPAVELAVAAFGPDRLMFGSDWPVCLLASTYRGVAETAATLLAGLSGAEQAAVFAGNARRCYRIPAARRAGKDLSDDAPAHVPGEGNL